ncbi:NADH:ubiquinone reductase (H(+)-translocating) [Ranunculus cassubicifolius]
MAYGACYLKGTRIFDRGGMIAGPSPRSARWPMGIAAFGLCLPFLIKNSGSARESAGNNRKEGVHPFLFLLGKNGEVHPNRPMKNKRRAKRQWRAKLWRRSGRAHSLRFLGPKQFSPGRGLEVPTTTPHYTWLYTFTELTPVQCQAELTGPYLFRGESGASRSTVERKILGPSSFSTGVSAHMEAGQR